MEWNGHESDRRSEKHNKMSNRRQDGKDIHTHTYRSETDETN